MLNVEKLAGKIFEKAKEEYALLKKLYDQSRLDDFEISCNVNFYKNNKNIAYYDTLFLKNYIEENKFEKFLESLSITLFVSWKAERELKNIENSDFATFKIISHFQKCKENVKLEKLESVLFEFESKFFQLRDELHIIYFEKFPYYSMSLNAWIVFEDPDAEEVSLEIEDFKYPPLSHSESFFFSNFGLRLRQFKRLCGEKPLNASPIKKVYGSLNVSTESVFKEDK